MEGRALLVTQEAIPAPIPIPLELTDPVNTAILEVAEDSLEGFQRDPFAEIARRSEVPLDDVIERIAALLEAGTIRRVRQTLMATNLAQGSLVAWQVPQERLQQLRSGCRYRLS